ncbi:hypothetical protein HDU93_009713 [Gonapodya sp. JEL0774]|nr:hypothetical protein HDU93_009713 [Gonapodya sp. JEL0774]
MDSTATTQPTYSQKEYAIITGFEPFGNFPVNPSWEAVKHLHERDFQLSLAQGPPGDVEPHRSGAATCTAVCRLLPVEYRAIDVILPTLHTTPPCPAEPLFYLHFGASGQSPHDVLSIETVAHGFGYEKPDNAKIAPEDGLVGGAGRDLALAPQLDIVDALLKTFGTKGGPEAEVVPVRESDSDRDTATPTASSTTPGPSVPIRPSTRRPRPWTLRCSDNAGRYLCEYVLHHSLRARGTAASGGGVPVLFVHVPPVGKGMPLSEVDLQMAVEEIVRELVAVCWRKKMSGSGPTVAAGKL